MERPDSDFNLTDILNQERIATYFQPIISLKTGTIFAYEALVRGIGTDGRTLISPNRLFARADRETVSLEFDRLCRKKALERFNSFHLASNAMLFINVNTAVISAGKGDRPHIGNLARQIGFEPHEIGLELIESPSDSPGDLIDFANRYRELGFLIVIDDFGSEYSNLDRLIHIHPDIIKIDRNLITGISQDTYRQSIVKSIHSLAQMTGSLCLAEGVETLDEIKTCNQIGIDLFQGFAVGFPAPDLEALERTTLLTIPRMQEAIRLSAMEAFRARRRLTGDINILADWLIRQIKPTNIDHLRTAFQEFMAMNSEIECIYILDGNGKQITDTITTPFIKVQTRHSIFSPAAKGSDHSFKTYYTCFEALKVSRYLTDVYLSLASGNLCRTFSVRIENDVENIAKNCILCMDFLEEEIKTTYTGK